MIEQRFIIFGTGEQGLEALRKYEGKVDFFVDNDINKHGKNLNGIEIKPVESILSIPDDKVIVASMYYYEEMGNQLKKMGISNFEVFGAYKKYYGGTDELINNPYDNGGAVGGETESGWKEIVEKRSFIKKRIREEVDKTSANQPLFSHIEIETVNRCNGLCSFCPVNAKSDSRKRVDMSWEMFEKIITELQEIDYSGRLALFSNNEPFLDKTIIEKHKYAREHLHKARMHLFTNGTLLTIDKMLEIIDYLDELVVDNYSQNLELIPQSEAIVEYARSHPEIVDKVTIVLRKQQEILTSRGGDAPNRQELISYNTETCVLPFKQIIVRPDGKVSLCCNDPMGKMTMGDVSCERITDIWYGARFSAVRNSLKEGRGKIDHCRYCDTFYLG